MTRLTVSASRDPRAPPLPRFSQIDWPSGVPHLSDRQTATLTAVFQTLCPHEWLEAALYRDAVLAFALSLQGDASSLAVLRDGLSRLDEASPPFAEARADARLKALRQIETTPFFRLCLTGAVRRLYDLPEVWAGCGYDGAAGCSDDKPRDDFLTPGAKR